jgi:hypothetical protein
MTVSLRINIDTSVFEHRSLHDYEYTSVRISTLLIRPRPLLAAVDLGARARVRRQQGQEALQSGHGLQLLHWQRCHAVLLNVSTRICAYTLHMMSEHVTRSEECL